MRLLLSTSGSRGDFEPLVALAVRLRALDAEVRVCAPPAAEERLAEFDLQLVPVGLPDRVLLHDGMARPTPEDECRLVAGEIAMQFDRVPAAAEGCDGVMVTGVLAAAVGVRSVAEKLGIPSFYAAYSAAYLPSAHHGPPLDERTTPGVTDNQVLWDQRGERFGERYRGPVNSQRAAIGLPPLENVFAYGNTDRPWLAADPTLAPRSADQDVVQTGAWILPDKRPLPAELKAFLTAGSPPVYVGFGSSAGTGIGDAARVTIEAIRAQGRRVVLSQGWADLALPDEGGDCLAVGEVNLRELFGWVAAVIHVGSAGTTHVAAAAGVPQIVIPQYTDQPYYADRVAELGIGVAHDGPTPTFESLSAALVVALAPETRARAFEVARKISADGAAVAAELLLDAVSRAKSTASV